MPWSQYKIYSFACWGVCKLYLLKNLVYLEIKVLEKLILDLWDWILDSSNVGLFILYITVSEIINVRAPSAETSAGVCSISFISRDTDVACEGIFLWKSAVINAYYIEFGLNKIEKSYQFMCVKMIYLNTTIVLLLYFDFSDFIYFKVVTAYGIFCFA